MHLLTSSQEREAAGLRDLYDDDRYVRGGMVSSLDGSAAHDGRSGPLQAPGDSEVFRTLRAVADVVLVGAGTVRAEDYGPVALDDAARAWRASRGRAAQVPLAVVSRSLDLGAAPRWLAPDAFVVTCAAAPAGRREQLAGQVRLVVAGEDEVDLGQALQALAELGLQRVLCEGGPRLLGDLVRARLLSELCATVSPLLAGAGPGLLAGVLPTPVPLQLVHLLREQDTLMGRWRVQQ